MRLLLNNEKCVIASPAKGGAKQSHRFRDCFVASLLATTVLMGCQRSEPVKVQKPQEVIPVRVQKAELKDLDEVLEYSGNIRAQDEVVVYPKVSGKIIEKLKQDGDPVAKADAIAFVDRDEVGYKFKKAPVESPISGTVGRVYVDIGSNVSAQTPVALVVNLENAKINLDIPEKYLPKIYTGQSASVSVDAYPQEVFTGAVTKVSPVVDLENRAAPVEIVIENKEGRLKPGMFARVDLAIGRYKASVVILKEAVIGKGADTYVFVVEGNKAALKRIKLGIRQGQYYKIEEGLKEGELVVVVGQQLLHDGAEVKPEE